MKTVTYYDKTFEVPDWANYVVAEADGIVWVFEHKPEQMYLEHENDVEWYVNNTKNPISKLEWLDVEFPANDGKEFKLMGIPINVMIDLETLGRSAGCSVMSIGAVEFSDKLGKEFYVSIDRQSCLDAGLFEDSETVDWWMKQSEEAKAVFYERKENLNAALIYFWDYLDSLGPRENLRIWGFGAAFDNAIVIALYRIVNMPLPWNYNGDMCFRTLKAILPAQKMQRVGVYHNALDDAKTQAAHAIKLLKVLNA